MTDDENFMLKCRLGSNIMGCHGEERWRALSIVCASLPQAVMLASAAACGYMSGVGDLLFGHCRPWSSLTAFSIFRPWAALEFGSVLGVNFQTVDRAALSCFEARLSYPL